LELQLVPNRGQVKHLLWTLLFFKVYATELVLASICGCNAETYRDWVREILDCLGKLRVHVVSPSCCFDPTCCLHLIANSLLLFNRQIVWANRYIGNSGSLAHSSIDCTDCSTEEPQPFS